jgi:hypothetical protein
MDFNINSNIIFKTFSSEWTKRDDLKDINKNALLMWKEFIKSLDIGIECIKSCEFPNNDVYKVIDEKKWLLAKIKYGF